jgi:hypothetical protein
MFLFEEEKKRRFHQNTVAHPGLNLNARLTHPTSQSLLCAGVRPQYCQAHRYETNGVRPKLPGINPRWCYCFDSPFSFSAVVVVHQRCAGKVYSDYFQQKGQGTSKKKRFFWWEDV